MQFFRSSAPRFWPKNEYKGIEAAAYLLYTAEANRALIHVANEVRRQSREEFVPFQFARTSIKVPQNLRVILDDVNDRQLQGLGVEIPGDSLIDQIRNLSPDWIRTNLIEAASTYIDAQGILSRAIRAGRIGRLHVGEHSSPEASALTLLHSAQNLAERYRSRRIRPVERLIISLTKPVNSVHQLAQRAALEYRQCAFALEGLVESRYAVPVYTYSNFPDSFELTESGRKASRQLQISAPGLPTMTFSRNCISHEK